jgi:hypothetical protein
MTGGALIQLIAYGAQDVYLTGNPQITFFRLVYRRHSNFSMEWVAQRDVNSNGRFGRKMEVVIDRVGDLLGAMHLELIVPALKQQQPGFTATGAAATSTWVGYCNSFMHAVVRSVEMQIGGQQIDKLYGDWLEIWSELTIDESKQAGYKQMVGKWNTNIALQCNAVPSACQTKYRFRLPLQFWFNRNPSCYLPLLALQYHEVRFVFDIRAPAELIKSDVNIPNPLAYDGKPWDAEDIQLWSNYVYLDTEERRKFIQASHEMLIEQLQFNSAIGIADRSETLNATMEYNHPLKEVIWVIPDAGTCDNAGNSLFGNDYFHYSPNGLDTFSVAKLIFNGNDRFDAKPAEYFRQAQPFEHHTRIPSKHIYVYSFGLKPEEIQPSGTCNASRLDDFTVHINFGSAANGGCCLNTNRQLRMYAHNYNILRIMSGQGGLAFSN